MSTTDPNSPNNPPTTSAPRAQGDKLAGCYALSRRLEVGDGTEVWLAHDEVLGKDVSLHFVPDAIRKDSRALQELRQDIKRNRQLIHPNILRVYDLVEEPEWVAISMDAFEGESLTKRLNGKAGTIGEVQSWVQQLAGTLEEAHKINVLHRDLTPSNLFLTQADKLLVASFGISRTIRDAQVRAGGEEVASMAYESPQLLDGKSPSRTDDVYSLGAVVFAMLAGKPPFIGKDLAQQVRAGVSPETLAALKNDVQSLPADWQAAIAACLDKSPEARPQSAAEVGRRLASVEAEPAVFPVPVTSPVIESAPIPAPVEVEAKPVPVMEPVPMEEPIKAIVEPQPEVVVAEPKPEAPQPAEPKSEVPKTDESKSEGLVLKESKKEIEIVKSAPTDAPAKSPERPLSADFKPRLYPEESRFPVTGLAAAAAVIVVIAIIYHLASPAKPGANSNTTEQQPEKGELRPLTHPTPPVVPSTPTESAPVVHTPSRNQTPSPAVAPLTGDTAKAIADKKAALDKAKQDAEAAEKSYTDLLKQQQLAEASLAEVQKGIDEKMKTVEPLKKAADEAVAQRKKLETEQKATETAAQEAQKVAAEKVRLAEEGAKALAELDKKVAEKTAAPQQAETEIAALQKTFVEKQRLVADGAKALAQAEAAKQQQLAVIAGHTSEIERIKSSDMEAQRQKEAAVEAENSKQAERAKLDKELAEMQRIFNEKMDRIKQLDSVKAGTPPPTLKPQTPPPATPAVAVVTPVATPPPITMATPKAATPAPATPPMQVASIPMATPALASPATPAPTVVAGGNSLGMKFAPVGDVEFCVWQTRVKDFEVFAKAVNLKSTSWKGPGFKQGPDHPVVNVSWQEAIAFCKWLTDKEHKDNTLPANQFYRLPTDLEWSKAVGLSEESGKTPEMRDMGVPDIYPWGNQWPPPVGAGNYTGEETGSDVAIKGYDDGFAWTSPVGSFPPNKFGLYDMGGNVWQWCMDTWNAESKAKVLRGASWYNGALKLSLLSSCRVHAAPDSSTDNYGFRLVRAKEEAKAGKK